MAKAPNYSAEVTEVMKAEYSAVAGESEAVRDAMVAEFATRYGKSVRSIRAKLSREAVYVSKTPVSAVTGDKPAKKDELAAELVAITGLALVSAEKLNKTDLVALIAFATAAKAAVLDTDSLEVDETSE